MMLCGLLDGFGGAAATGLLVPAARATTLDSIRQADEQDRAERAEFADQIRAINALLDDMRRTAFRIEVRIAKIKAGEYERNCDDSARELQDIDTTLAAVRDMQKEADQLCGAPSTTSKADIAAICSSRRSELGERLATLTTAREMLVSACASHQESPK